MAEVNFSLVKLLICSFKLFELSREFFICFIYIGFCLSYNSYTFFILLVGRRLIVKSLDLLSLFFQFSCSLCVFLFLFD